MKLNVFPDIQVSCYNVVSLAPRWDKAGNSCRYQIAECNDGKYLLFIDLVDKGVQEPSTRLIKTFHDLLTIREALRVNYAHFKYLSPNNVPSLFDLD